LYSNFNNINNAKDKSVLQMYPDIPKSVEDYGMTAQIGLRLKI